MAETCRHNCHIGVYYNLVCYRRDGCRLDKRATRTAADIDLPSDGYHMDTAAQAVDDMDGNRALQSPG